MKKNKLIFGIVLVSSVWSVSVHAAPEKKTLYFASDCANCHGTDGRSVTEIMPSIAGQDRQTLLDSLRAYKSKERGGTIMPQLMQGYNDTELEQLATFFSTQKK